MPIDAGQEVSMHVHMPMDRQSWMSVVPGSKLQVSLYECKSFHMEQRLPTAPFWSLLLYHTPFKSLFPRKGRNRKCPGLRDKINLRSSLYKQQHALYLAF